MVRDLVLLQLSFIVCEMRGWTTYLLFDGSPHTSTRAGLYTRGLWRCLSLLAAGESSRCSSAQLIAMVLSHPDSN